MNWEKRKQIAATIGELYIYPNCSKGESTFRIVAWIFSWIFGVVVPETINAQTLGGCYFVLAISLLVDLFCENRKKPVAKVACGLFSVLLIFTVVGAIVLIAKAPPTMNVETIQFINVESEQLYKFVNNSLPWVGRSLLVIMLINLICILIDVRKLIFDEETSSKQEEENIEKIIQAEQAATAAGFISNLQGNPRGGDDNQ